MICRILMAMPILLSLVGCGRSASEISPDAPHIAAQLSFLDEIAIVNGTTPPARSMDTLPTGSIGELQAVLQISGEPIDIDEVGDLGIVPFWVVDSDTGIGLTMRRRFTLPGWHAAVFHAEDPLGDTLRDTLWLLVQSPLVIGQEIIPAAGANGVDPWSSGSLLLQWNLSGVDRWEKFRCAVHLSSSRDSVLLTNPLAMTEDQTIVRILPPDSLQAANKEFWWGLICSTYDSQGNQTDRDTSSLWKFRFRDPQTDMAQVLAILYLDGVGTEAGASLRLQGSVQTSLSLSNGTVHLDSITPGLRTLITSVPERPEYQPETLQVSLLPGSWNSLDTIHLQDHWPPQVRLLPWHGDTLAVLLSDDGSGINHQTLDVSWNGSLPLTFGWVDTLYLKANPKASGSDSGHVVLRISDNAGNVTKINQWLVQEAP